MPSHIKIILSILVLIVGAVVFYFEHQAGAGQAGAGTVKWVVAFLAVFMVFSMWVFPEAKGGSGKGGANQGN
jgi:hypothetical protein